MLLILLENRNNIKDQIDELNGNGQVKEPFY